MDPTLLALQHSQMMLASSDGWQSAFKWTANLFMAISAVAVSFSVDWAISPIAFLGFLIGHVLWATSGWAMRDKALIMLNVGFIPLDIYAMYIRL